jgi:hypothetical protein
MGIMPSKDRVEMLREAHPAILNDKDFAEALIEAGVKIQAAHRHHLGDAASDTAFEAALKDLPPKIRKQVRNNIRSRKDED